MKVIYSIKGHNKRMGGLFGTPKHMLLYKGRPAIELSVEYMSRFGQCIIVTDEDDTTQIKGATMVRMGRTDSIVDMLKQMPLKDQFFVVDCDIVPLNVPIPYGNTVYCFKNKAKELNQYSNFAVNSEGYIVKGNEKQEQLDVCGTGIYFFNLNDDFYNNAVGAVSLSQVFNKMVSGGRRVYANVENEVYRLGTLPDITGGFTGNKIDRAIIKTSERSEWEATWYELYQDKRDIPKIYHCEGQEITMEWLEVHGEIDVRKVHRMIEKYFTYKGFEDHPFSKYIGRITQHLTRNIGIVNGGKLLRKLSQITDIPSSFMHGDLSTINIIPTPQGLKLIDPLYDPERFSSYHLDYAKFLFSLKFYANDVVRYNEFRSLIDCEYIDTLIAAECVRVCTYKKEFNFIAENLIHEL